MQDVKMIYLYKNYEERENKVFKDFTNGIKDILKNIYNLCTEDFDEKLNRFFIILCEKIFEKMEVYLESEIFPNLLINKYEGKKKDLNEDEQRIVESIKENSEQKISELIKSNFLTDFFK